MKDPLQSIPGVGPRTAEDLHALGIDSVELEGRGVPAPGQCAKGSPNRIRTVVTAASVSVSM